MCDDQYRQFGKAGDGLVFLCKRGAHLDDVEARFGDKLERKIERL